MMLCKTTFSSLCPFFTRAPFFSSFSTCTNQFFYCIVHSKPIRRIQLYNNNNSLLGRGKMVNFCSSSILAVSAFASRSPLSDSSRTISRKNKRKEFWESPQGVLKIKLDQCSKYGDCVEALRLYDEARANGVPLTQEIYNSLLYLCSHHLGGENGEDNDYDMGLKRGFEIYQQMTVIDKIAPNEATFTNVARLAFAMEDPEMAFDLVKQMKSNGITPRLRSYGPALFGFCKNGMAKRAYQVDEHMAESGVTLEEPELSALLRVSVDSDKPEKVYEMLHRLRANVRQVPESTLGIIEDWFKSQCAARVGRENWDVKEIKEGIVRGGGGWHGQGWLGTGQWKVERTQMSDNGVCASCGEKLVCIDIDPVETENFASSLANLACKREARASFVEFQEWLQQHGPFDAVIDGANIGLFQKRDFSFFQLKTVVNQLHQLSPSKRLPLIILHRSRVTGGPAKNPNNQKLIGFWKKSGALYGTPPGSNDDWYWLYAAISCNCLLVTNDEMRDHLFQLLGTSFFPRWKEKHQVRISTSRHGVNLLWPPPYSIVIQESENGSWHVPTTSTDDDLESPRLWLCATRSRQR